MVGIICLVSSRQYEHKCSSGSRLRNQRNHKDEQETAIPALINCYRFEMVDNRLSEAGAGPHPLPATHQVQHVPQPTHHQSWPRVKVWTMTPLSSSHPATYSQPGRSQRYASQTGGLPLATTTSQSSKNTDKQTRKENPGKKTLSENILAIGDDLVNKDPLYISTGDNTKQEYKK